jgi:hypothetical protein
MLNSGLIKRCFACILVMILTSITVYSSEFNIGVYYFPGWKDSQVGAPAPKPWERIQAYPDLKPKLGWYDEGRDDVMNQQLVWMHQYGINFIAFDWLVGADTKVYLDHALNAYLRAADKKNVGFALMWTNHTDYNFSKAQYEAIFHIWATRYFARPEYQRLNGKPVVYLFSADVLNRNAKVLGMTTAEFTKWADAQVRKDGVEGVNFIGGTWGGRDKSFDYSTASGYAGFSAYNFHGPATFFYTGKRSLSNSYAELDAGYRDHWQWMVKHASGTFVVPMSSGWDKRPWGGSSDPAHDNSRSTPDEFAAHLKAAKKLMMDAPDITQKTGVICCWNEYGEGSIIEPSEKDGFAYLEKVRDVFGGGK